MVRSQRDNQRGIAVMLALLLCGAVSAVHKQVERSRGHDPVTGVVRDAAIVPAQTAGVRVGRWWRTYVVSVFSGPRLARQNQHLRTEVMQLSAENRQLLAAQQENDRLRQLLDFERKAPLPLLAAEVTALKPNNQQDTVIVNRGIADGVHLHTILLASNGALVGQVIDVSSHSCTALMLTDNNSSVGAQVKASQAGAPVGLCQGQGNGSNELKLTWVKSDAQIKPGDQVATSGLGGTFPANIPIGVVKSVSVDRTRSLKSAIIRPTADLDHLDEVFLVR